VDDLASVMTRISVEFEGCLQEEREVLLRNECDFYLLTHSDRRGSSYLGGREGFDNIWTNAFEARLFYEKDLAESEADLLAGKIDLAVVKSPSPTEIYYKYVDLVRYLTHRMGCPAWIDEAESYLGWLIMTKWNMFDLRVCRRTTWICRWVSGEFLDQRIRKAKAHARGKDLYQSNLPPVYNLTFDFGEDTKTIIDMIRADPEGCRQKFSRSNRRMKFEKCMRGLGWSSARVDRVMSELREMYV